MSRVPLPWPSSEQPVRFSVAGHPQTQGHKIAMLSHSTGRPVVVDAAKPALRAWRRTVRDTARRYAIQPWTGPVTVDLAFTLAPPQRIPAERRNTPSIPPDIDTLTRAVLDALTGVLFVDDGQVVALTAVKRYGADEGVEITAGPL